MKIAMFGIKGIPVPAGAENVAEQIGSRLVQRGHQVTIYVRPHYTPREIKEYKGIRLVHLPSIPTKGFDAITHSFLASIAVLTDKPDILHIHGIGSSIFSMHPRWFGVKTVVQSHGLDWQRAKWGSLARNFLKMTDYSSAHFPDATAVVNQKMQQHYRKISADTIYYIPNGVMMVEPRPPDVIHQWGIQGNDYILFAARLVPEKGLHYLLESYRRLGNCHKKLIIAGDANYSSQYVDDLKKQANQNIIFTGFVTGEPLRELLSNAYLYVLPSEIEGLSTGLLEAMSYGNCVLVSDIDENIEVIGQAGATFHSKDVEDLEWKLRELLGDEKKVTSYRALARSHVNTHFNWEAVTDQFELLYKSLISN